MSIKSSCEFITQAEKFSFPNVVLLLEKVHEHAASTLPLFFMPLKTSADFFLTNLRKSPVLIDFRNGTDLEKGASLQRRSANWSFQSKVTTKSKGPEICKEESQRILFNTFLKTMLKWSKTRNHEWNNFRKKIPK